MKFLLPAAIVCCSLPLFAQTAIAQTGDTTSSSTTTTTAPAPAPAAAAAAPSSGNPMMDRVLSSLTPEEKNQIIAARTKAMTDNPDLQTAEMSLMEKGLMLRSDSATEADKQAFRAAIKDHVEKVRAAMLKADPTIQPILTKLEAEAAKVQAAAQPPAQ
jgi:hypothetical protein